MQERIKEHDRDIRLARTETSAVSEHAIKTGRIYGQRDRNAMDSGIIKKRMPLLRLPVF